MIGATSFAKVGAAGPLAAPLLQTTGAAANMNAVVSRKADRFIIFPPFAALAVPSTYGDKVITNCP